MYIIYIYIYVYIYMYVHIHTYTLSHTRNTHTNTHLFHIMLPAHDPRLDPSFTSEWVTNAYESVTNPCDRVHYVEYNEALSFVLPAHDLQLDPLRMSLERI